MAAGLQVAAQTAVVAVELVGGHPGGRHAGVEGAGEHPPSMGDLGRELDVVGHAGGGAAGGVVGPRLGQVQLPVDQRPSRWSWRRPGTWPPGRSRSARRCRCTAAGHPRCATPDLRSPVSSMMSTPVRVAQLVDHEGPQVITHGVGVPHRIGQQPLHPVRAACPACSANCQHDLLSTSDSRPSSHSRAARAAPPARTAQRSGRTPSSNTSIHASGSTMAAAATARLRLSTTDNRSAMAVSIPRTTRDLYLIVTKQTTLIDGDLHHEMRLYY